MCVCINNVDKRIIIKQTKNCDNFCVCEHWRAFEAGQGRVAGLESARPCVVQCAFEGTVYIHQIISYGKPDRKCFRLFLSPSLSYSITLWSGNDALGPLDVYDTREQVEK